jgi:PAS domain S-box-containing protein
MRMPPEQLAAVVKEASSRDNNDSAVIATDAAGTIVYWNPHATALYGWRSKEAIGRNILDVTPTRFSVDEAAAIMETLRRGENWTGEFIVQRRDGTPILAHVTDIPVRENEEVIGIVGISRRS